MKKITIGLNCKDRLFDLEVYKCNFLESWLGLMFKKRKNARILLFDLGSDLGFSLHSFFVFFPFLVVFIDDKNRMVDKRIVKPFTPFIFSKKEFSKIIEIPVNDKYLDIIKILDG